MIDLLFVQARVRARLRSGPLSPFLEDLAGLLEQMGYPKATARRHIRSAESFCLWLRETGRTVADVTPDLMDRYRRQLPRVPCRGRPQGRLPERAFGLEQFSEVLRRKGIIAPPPAERSPWDEWLVPYARHLERTAGVAAGTRRIYLRYARALLSSCFGSGPPEPEKLTAKEVAGFVCRRASRLKPSSSRLPVSATRAFLRFLAVRGMVPPGLEHAVPTVRQWKLASLPRHLPAETVAKVLALSQGASAANLRDRAILLLLARLGLRAGEVSRLTLEDVDWRAGRLLIPAAKSARERLLPLPADAGEALARYLGGGRPRSPSRRIFLGCRAPHRPLSPSSISHIARRALRRAGVSGVRLGAHVFRHSAATGMVRRGASFKEAADVLGHARLETTAIYAKLDLARLAGVALPWPGGAR